MQEGERLCSRCVMDTTDPDIRFDQRGICSHCIEVDGKLNNYPHNLDPQAKSNELLNLVSTVKRAGKGRKYDCIVGVSGGVDSTYVVLQARAMGLRPLAVHLDNGWDSELAVHNIERMCKKLDVDLLTYVIDWEEFRDIQLSFLKASTPDSEIPTDHAIKGILYRMAAKMGLKFIISGENHNTESILPFAWSHGHNDWKYIKSVHNRFGTISLKTYPGLSYLRAFYYVFVKRIRTVNLLDFIEFSRADAIKLLSEQLDWVSYGGKHHESLYTKFFQAYILPEKFGFDKRKAHLSSLVCAGEVTRDQALKELEKELYVPSELDNDKEYVATKLGISPEELQRILDLPPKRFWDYPSYENSWYFKIARGIYRELTGKGKRSVK